MPTREALLQEALLLSRGGPACFKPGTEGPRNFRTTSDKPQRDY